MRRSLLLLALLALATALAAPGATAGGEPATAAKLKGCPVKDSFMTGPFFAWRVRARGMGCRAARTQAKKWGDTRPCVYSDGPNDHTCRAGGYRCVTRDVGYEGGLTRCVRKGRAVSWRWSS